MKSERRHELRENDLSHALETASRYFQENGKWIGLAVVAAVVAVVVVNVSRGNRAALREDAWLSRNALSFESLEEGRRSLDTLSSLARSTTEEGFVMTALMDIGNQGLRLARMTQDPPDSRLNAQAREAFERLLEQFPKNLMAIGAAHHGLATVEENEFVLDHDPVHQTRARAHLAAVIEDPSLHSLPFHRMASDRLKKLADTFTTVRFEPAPVPVDEPSEEIADLETATDRPDDYTIRLNPDGTTTTIMNP